MGYKPRIDYPGAFHHVTESHNLVVYAFCIMSNHVHLYVETPEANLSIAMHHLLNRYKAYYNKKHKRMEGNVFGKPFTL